MAEGLELLAGAGDRLRPLLVLAQAYQRQDSWLEAARLQEEALRLARTRPREAMVRRQIGLRLLGEGRYGEAAAELEWAATSTAAPAASTTPRPASTHSSGPGRSARAARRSRGPAGAEMRSGAGPGGTTPAATLRGAGELRAWASRRSAALPAPPTANSWP